MRINPGNKNETEKLQEENLLRQRLAILFVFAGVFGFFVKILFF